MAAQQFAFEKNLTYTIYTAFDEVIEPTGLVGPHFDWETPAYWTTGEQTQKSITWKIGSNSDFDTGIFLDGSPWVKDNGDIHLLEVTPASAMKQNAFYENFAVNETVINPDLGKAVSSQIGQTSKRCGDNIQGYKSTVDTSQYGAALKIGKTCIPNKAFLNWNLAGWTDEPTEKNPEGVHHDDGGDKGFRYDEIDEQTATDWMMYKLITDEDTGGGKGTVAFNVGWDGRGSLTAAPRSAPRDEPPANNKEASDRGMVYIDKDGSVQQGVDPVDQAWIFNWQSGFGWQRTSLSRSLVSENTEENSDPISGVDHWWTEGNVTRGTKEDGGRLYQNAQENSRPRPGLDPDGGVRYYGTSNTDLLSNVGGCSTAYDKALEYSGEFLDRHGVVRYSGVWDRKPRKLETYDSVLGCNSHYSESGMLAAREEFRKIYQRFLDGWQGKLDKDGNRVDPEHPEWVIDVSGWDEVDGESPPEGNDGLLSWDYDLNDISYEQSSPTKFAWGNGQPRGSCVNIFASLTVVPDDEESNFTDWNKKFRPPMNWDPTDKPNMPFMEELEDIEEFNLGGDNPNYGDSDDASNYAGSFQKYYPEVDMDGVQYGWVRQPNSDQYPMTREVYGNYWKLWDYFLEKTWGIGSVNFRPPRFGSTRLLLSPSDQDDSVQGFSNSKANAASEYGSSEAMMQEPTMLLAFDKNVDTDPLFDEMKDHHGLNNTPEELRQRLRRVITQKGIDLYGAYASLGKRVVSNAGHGEPYDWYLFFALGTVDSQGANNSRDKIKHIYEGNIGNVANGTYTTIDTEKANSMEPDGNGYGSYSSSLYAIGPQLGVQWNINNSSVDALPGPTTGTWGETHPTGGVLHGGRIHSVIAENVENHTLPDPGQEGGPTSTFAWGTPTGSPTNRLNYQTLTIKAPLPSTCGGGYGSGYDEDTGEWDVPPSGVEGLMEAVSLYRDDNENVNIKIRPLYDQVENREPIPHDKLYHVNGYDSNQANICTSRDNNGCDCSPNSGPFSFKTTIQGKGLWNMAINKPPYFATNKFVGFYVRNRRTNKITRIVSQGVDNTQFECASSGDTLKGLVYPTNMSIVLTLQENIDIQENEKVDLIPASVQDIDSGYAVFNDTGEMSSMIGLGNYDYVFTRGQGTVALITRLLAWSDSSIPNSVAGIRDALPTYWKFIYDKSIGFSTYEPLRFKGFTPNYGASKLLYTNGSSNAPHNQSGGEVINGGLTHYPNPDLIQWKDIGWPTLFRAFIRSLLVDQLDKPLEMAHFYNDVPDHIYRWPSCSNDTSVDVCNTSSLGTIGAVITERPSYQGPQHVHVDDVEGNQISSLDSDGNPRLCSGGNQCDVQIPPNNLADGIEFYRVSIPRDVDVNIAQANLEELLGDCSNCTKTLDPSWKDYRTYDAVVLRSRKTNYNDKDGEYSSNESLDYSYVNPNNNYKLHVWVGGTNKPVEMKLIAEAKIENDTQQWPQDYNWTQIWALPHSIKYTPHLYAKYRGDMDTTHFFATC